MGIRKTEAIILRSLKFRETSKILTLLTTKDGILKMLAKGVRGSRSRMAGILEPLSVVEVVYYDRAGRDLQLLSQAGSLYAPKKMLEDEQRLFIALACAEIISRLELSNEAGARIYGLFRALIETMDRQESGNAGALFLGFKMRLLGVLGLAPELQNCAHCQKRIAGGAMLISEARLYCQGCAPKAGELLWLNHETLDNVRLLATISFEKLSRSKLSPPALAAMYNFIEAFYSCHLEEVARLRSIDVLKKMKMFANHVQSLQHWAQEE